MVGIPERNKKLPGMGNGMWIIIRTLKGKNTFLTGSGEWSKDATTLNASTSSITLSTVATRILLCGNDVGSAS